MPCAVMNAPRNAERARADRCRPGCSPAVQMDAVCEPVIRRRAERHLEKRRGNHSRPGVRALFHHRSGCCCAGCRNERATRCSRAPVSSGIHDSDPRSNPAAKRYDTVDCDTVLAENLKVSGRQRRSPVPRDNKDPDRRLLDPQRRAPGPECWRGAGTQTAVFNEGKGPTRRQCDKGRSRNGDARVQWNR